MNIFKKHASLLIALNALLFFSYINFGIISKEKILDTGQLVLLELAPKDPRSIMQGDYMVINYALTQQVTQTDHNHKKIPQTGYAVVTLDNNRVAKLLRFQAQKTPKQAKEILLKYKRKSTASSAPITFGTDTYFFEEGQGERFENAHYGALKVDANGNALLTDLYDKNLKVIKK